MTNKIPYYDIEFADNIRDLISNAKNRYKDKPLYCYGNNDSLTISFNELEDIVKAGSTYLLENNYKNSNIAIIGENSVEWVLAYFMILCSGNVVVPLDRNGDNDELKTLVNKCDCSCLFYTKSLENTIKDNIDIDAYCLSDIFDFVEQGKNYLNNGSKLYDEVLINKDSLASIVFTSGTSGGKKGVMLTHGNLVIDAYWCSCFVLGKSSQIFLPLHHTLIWAGGLLGSLFCGAEIHFSSNMRRIVKDLQNNKPTLISAVPMMVEMLYNGIINKVKKDNKEKSFKALLKLSKFLMNIGIDVRRKLFKEVIDSFGGKLEYIVCGGAFLNKQIEEDLFYMGIQIISGYGITECSPVVALTRPKVYRFGSVGKILPCNEVKIANPDNKGIGEIWVTGDNVMKGYYKDEEETNNSFEDKWFKTGDLGYIDKDGFLYITGRLKNLIILSNGENISPEEIEKKFYNLPYIKEFVVYEENNVITGEFYLDEENYPEARNILKNDVDFYNRNNPSNKNIGKIKYRNIPFEKTSTLKIKRYLIDKK